MVAEEVLCKVLPHTVLDVFSGAPIAVACARNDQHVEALLGLDEGINEAHRAGRVDGVVVDCLTVWLGNLMHRNGVDKEVYPEVQDFLNRLENPPCDVVMVTNEIGMGIVPDNAMSRRFRDLAGKLNQDAAILANVVILIVCGHSIVIKE